MTGPPSDLAEAREWVGDAHKVVVVGGAGMSAPSGLATYRSGNGGWDNPVLEALSHAARYRDHLVDLWLESWGPRRASYLTAQPNPAHRALADWERHLAVAGGQLLVATQNVDGLHQAAGSTNVVEVHGSLMRSRCVHCTERPAWDDTTGGSDVVPTCPGCGAAARPDVVLFGEMLDPAVLERVRAALAACDLCVYAGTSGEVAPVCDLVSIAHAAGARCVLVNDKAWRHPHPDFDRVVLGDVAAVLPALLDGL